MAQNSLSNPPGFVVSAKLRFSPGQVAAGPAHCIPEAAARTWPAEEVQPGGNTLGSPHYCFAGANDSGKGGIGEKSVAQTPEINPQRLELQRI